MIEEVAFFEGAGDAAVEFVVYVGNWVCSSVSEERNEDALEPGEASCASYFGRVVVLWDDLNLGYVGAEIYREGLAREEVLSVFVV